MPIYEYACGKCGHEFEAEQRITEDPLKTCPECRSRQVKRLISQTSFVLKGGGWYSDLYSAGMGKSKEKADASEGSPKSDAKPADKAKDTTKETGKNKRKGSPKAAA